MSRSTLSALVQLTCRGAWWALLVASLTVAVPGASHAQTALEELRNAGRGEPGSPFGIEVPGDPRVPGPDRGQMGGSIDVQVGAFPEQPSEPEAVRGDLPPPRVSVEQAIDPALYICGPGDVLEINFWGQQNFRLVATADLEGRAFIAKVGFVELSGKPLSEVRKLIQRRVRQQYPGLTFDVSLLRPRTFLVHVVDNVQKPGTHRAQALDRVSSVLERAGGKGSRRRIAVRRADGSVVNADLVLYERTGDTRHNPFVLDGDVITVPVEQVRVTVTGPVHHPGTYELVGSRDMAELFELAGGFKSSVATSLPIQLVRRDTEQRAASLYFPFTGGKTPNAPLNDDDMVRVRSVDELQRTILLFAPVEGADTMDDATAVKRLPYVEGDSVRTIIERAGGIKTPGDLRKAYISRPKEGKAPEVIPIDLEALLVRRELEADRPVQMGDEIVVPPIRRAILVQGAVGRPGLYPYNPNFGVPEFIAHAGGLTRNARKMRSVELIDPSGKTAPYEQGMKVHPGDAILVPERNFARGEIVSLVLAGAGLVLSGLTLALVVDK